MISRYICFNKSLSTCPRDVEGMRDADSPNARRSAADERRGCDRVTFDSAEVIDVRSLSRNFSDKRFAVPTINTSCGNFFFFFLFFQVTAARVESVGNLHFISRVNICPSTARALPQILFARIIFYSRFRAFPPPHNYPCCPVNRPASVDYPPRS